MTASESYFITWKGQRDGPYSLEHLADMLKRGEIGMLHRVETSSGLVPLRQLLIAADPARWAGHATAHPGSGPLPPPPDLAPRAPGGSQTSAPIPAAPLPAAPEAPATNGKVGMDDSPQAMAAYVVCGLSFLVPPLAWWAQKLAKMIEMQGSPRLADRLRLLSLGLASGGVVFWVLLLAFWRKW